MNFSIEKNKETIEGIDYDVIAQCISPDADSIKEFFERILTDNRTNKTSIQDLFNSFFYNKTEYYNNWSIALYENAYSDLTKEVFFNEYIGMAEVKTEYVGVSVIKGSINKKESKVIKGAKSLKIHYVFDFPTHAANGLFNTIHIYNKPLDSGFVDNVRVNKLNLYIKKSYLTFQSSVMTSYFNMATDNKENILVFNNESSNSEFVQVYYSLDGETGNTKFITTQNRGICYLNDKFYTFSIKDWKAINSNHVIPLNIVKENNEVNITLENENRLNLYSIFLKYTDINPDQGGMYIHSCFEWNDEIFFIVQEIHSSTNERSKNIFIGVTDKNFIYKRFKKYILNKQIFATGITYSKAQNLYYSKESDYMYIFNDSGGIYFNKDFTTINEFSGTLLTTENNRLFYTPNNSSAIGVVKVPAEYVFYHCGEINILNPMFTIQLKNPMVKNSSETMKLIFDITINSL